MDKPATNADGSYTTHFGPQPPENPDANYIATVPGKGFLVIVSLYGPGERFFNGEWQPGDIVPA